MKPLGAKAYGSIGHLPGSRVGPSDHHVHEGQAAICTVKPRKGDRVIVQEKLDGTNVAVAMIGGKLVPLMRAGYTAASSIYAQHWLFHEWAMLPEQSERFRVVLREGERIVGEWLAQAHGTIYALKHEPFVAFDIMAGKERMTVDAMASRVAGAFMMAAVVSDGPAFSLDDARAFAQTSRHGAVGGAEGVVYRVEREGRVDFLAKWVRPDKLDGYLLQAVSGGAAVWHWWPGCPKDNP
ncbi:hypothetical protein EBT16_01570 [bacterium]|nr:hypothetical protein [bacterium]